MTPEQAKLLRAPFPPELIGHLPRAGLKLDYVGHAAVTDRILSVDADWTWEPMARDPNTGAPLLSPNEGGMPGEPFGLWGKLTICDVTKPAFGGGKNAKECISDLIRNGAMRFGVGLDLWSKEDLHVADETAGGAEQTPSPQKPDASGAAPASPPASPPAAETPEQHRERLAKWWNEQDGRGLPAKIAKVDDPDRLRLLLEIESERIAEGKPQRKTIQIALSSRIRELEPDLEGEPTATTDAPAETSLSPEAAQDGPVTEPASPSETEPGEDGLDTRSTSPGSTNGEVLRLKAALGWIQDQPSSVDNPQLWTVKDVLWALSQRGGGTYGLIEEIPPEWLEAIWVAIPEGVRSSVEMLGPEAKADLASKAK